MNHSNNIFNAGYLPQKQNPAYDRAQQAPAYDRAQSAIGAPAAETLQVDESMQALLEVVEFHTETVLALMRRLEPVTGEVMIGDIGHGAGIAKVSLALRIDTQRDYIAKATAGLQATIRALQI